MRNILKYLEILLSFISLDYVTLTKKEALDFQRESEFWPAVILQTIECV